MQPPKTPPLDNPRSANQVPTSEGLGLVSAVDKSPATKPLGAMLSDPELLALFEQLSIPVAGQARIRHIRSSLPSRAVRSSRFAGKSRYAPLKMPFAIDVEATSTEYLAVVEWDHDQETLEFYGQIEPLKIQYRSPNGARLITVTTTPDFLRIATDAVQMIECKTEDELLKLAKDSPNRYCKDSDGRWRSPPAEVAAAEFGCQFIVRSSAQNNWTLFENCQLLKDYCINRPVVVPRESEEYVLRQLQEKSWVSTFDLIHCGAQIPADHVYGLIVNRQVFFPLTHQRLADQERALIFRDELTYSAFQTFLGAQCAPRPNAELTINLAAGASFDWDGVTWQVLNVGQSRIALQRLGKPTESGIAELTPAQVADLVREGRIKTNSAKSMFAPTEAEALIRKASPAQLQIAAWKYQAIFGSSDSSNPMACRKHRARMYWKANYKAAEEACGNGFVGLLPRPGGNRHRRVSEETLAKATEIINADWETIRNKKARTSWGSYRDAAKQSGLLPVSYVTFLKLIKQRSGHQQLASRIGEKAAYAIEPQFFELEWTTPRHGVRQWQIAHIDHTPVPLKLVHSELAKIVPTIWVTILSDAYSRKVLAYYLSFDPPSYRSCMMVLRACVKRHNRVPQMIVSDQGSEFNSIYWEKLLAFLRCDKKERRAGKPRDGSVCERLFNTSISQFISNLLGSTDVVENHFRRISPEVEPERHAVWTLDKFDHGMQCYLDEVFHVNHHSGLGMSPNEAWALGARSHGTREHRLIPYDTTFIAQSCPEVHRGTAKVTPSGIKVNYRWFKCDAFGLPGTLDKQVPARFDPFNAGIAYAYVHGEWTVCFSEYYAVFSRLTERAVWLATQQLRLRDKRCGRAAAVNAERLAGFLRNIESQEEIARQVLNDLEADAHRNRISTPKANAPQLPLAPMQSVRLVTVQELEDL